jgi:hypothetical protein
VLVEQARAVYLAERDAADPLARTTEWLRAHSAP